MIIRRYPSRFFSVLLRRISANGENAFRNTNIPSESVHACRPIGFSQNPMIYFLDSLHDMVYINAKNYGFSGKSLFLKNLVDCKFCHSLGFWTCDPVGEGPNTAVRCCQLVS